MRHLINGLTTAAVAIALACSGGSVTAPAPGKGILAVKLTDAPLPLDSIAAVNVFIVRVDARRAGVDSSLGRAHCDSAVNADLEHEHDGDEEFEHDRPDSTRWVTIASPNRAFNLLDLQNGVTAFLGQTAVDTGHFKAIRIVIDPAQSTIVLKDGTEMSPASTPPVEFENRGRHGLLVEFDESVEVEDGATTTLVLDIRLGSSVSLRGLTLRDGFFFRPVVTGRPEHKR